VGVSGYIPDFHYLDVEKIGRISVNVVSVSDRLINFTASISYRNGTITSENSTMDVLGGIALAIIGLLVYFKKRKH
jgi:LPXTG-motif cell wall-anchored protein